MRALFVAIGRLGSSWAFSPLSPGAMSELESARTTAIASALHLVGSLSVAILCTEADGESRSVNELERTSRRRISWASSEDKIVLQFCAYHVGYQRIEQGHNYHWSGLKAKGLAQQQDTRPSTRICLTSWLQYLPPSTIVSQLHHAAWEIFF
jgi:hypothetical protein